MTREANAFIGIAGTVTSGQTSISRLQGCRLLVSSTAAGHVAECSSVDDAPNSVLLNVCRANSVLGPLIALLHTAFGIAAAEM